MEVLLNASVKVGPGVVFQDLERPGKKLRLAVIKVEGHRALLRDGNMRHYTEDLTNLCDPKKYRVVRA